MKINSRIFSLPPYISTSWNNVVALHVKSNSLVVSLVDGDIIEIPGLQSELIDIIFAAHAAFMEYDIAREHGNHPSSPASNKISTLLSSLASSDATGAGENSAFRVGFSALDGFGSILQHNPAQANAPEIPKEILHKIGAIGKIVAPDDPAALPKAEPHCNCMYCQIARAITQEIPETEAEKKEQNDLPVSEEDLKFCQWDISQTSDKLFTVTNRLDMLEKYNVYLGEPVGCTCGKSGCEHLLAVLQS